MYCSETSKFFLLTKLDILDIFPEKGGLFHALSVVDYSDKNTEEMSGNIRLKIVQFKSKCSF